MKLHILKMFHYTLTTNEHAYISWPYIRSQNDRRLLGYIAITWIFWQAIFNNKQAYIYSFFCYIHIIGYEKILKFSLFSYEEM